MLLGNVLTSFEQYAQENKVRKNMNLEDFLRNAKQEFQNKASLESSSRIQCNCEKYAKMPTSLESVCCQEIPAVEAFHLKFKGNLSWNRAVLNFFAMEGNLQCRKSFLSIAFLRIFQKSFLSLIFNVFKMTLFSGISQLLCFYCAKIIPVSCSLPDIYWECSSGKFMTFSQQLSQKTHKWRLLQLVVTRKCCDRNIFFKKSDSIFLIYVLICNDICVPRD